MIDRVRTVDMSDPAVVLDCYRKLNVAYKELRAENEKLRAALAFYAKPENWHINGPLDANSANYTGGPASKILETEND